MKNIETELNNIALGLKSKFYINPVLAQEYKDIAPQLDKFISEREQANAHFTKKINTYFTETLQAYGMTEQEAKRNRKKNLFNTDFLHSEQDEQTEKSRRKNFAYMRYIRTQIQTAIKYNKIIMDIQKRLGDCQTNQQHYIEYLFYLLDEYYYQEKKILLIDNIMQYKKKPKQYQTILF